MHEKVISKGANVDVGELPWHRFGVRLCGTSSASSAIRQLRGILGQERADAKFPDLKPGLSPLPDLDLFTFFDPIVNTGAAIYDTIGALNQGKWVWLTAQMQTQSEVADGDPVAQFILLAYEQGRSNLPTMTFKPVRMFGKTTLSDDLLYPLIRVTMTPEGDTKLEDATQLAIQKIGNHFDSLINKFRAMLNLEFDEQRFFSYLDSVFPKPRAWGRGSKYEDSSERGRAIEECTRLFLKVNRESCPLASDTLWAAYNAVAQYVDFVETRLDDPQRLHQIWGSRLKRYALVQAMKILQRDVPRL